MRESNLQTAFGKWLKKEGANYFIDTAVFELKIEKTHRFAFSKVKEHQTIRLNQARIGLYYKISDSPIFIGQQTRFTAKKPFDAIFFKGCEAYIVIWFYKPRQPKIIYFVNITDFENLVDTHDKKSITEPELKEYIESFTVEGQIVDITKYFRSKI